LTNLGVLLVSAAFLVASIVGDLKDVRFTLILIVLSYPIYLLPIVRKDVSPSAVDALIVLPPE
jgi:hypothetical protein